MPRCNMELYEEETDTETYKIGIHTLPEFGSRPTPEQMMGDLYEETRKLLEADKFLCMIGGEHSVSAPVIKAHNEKFAGLSVLQIDARADLRDQYDGTTFARLDHGRVVKDLRIPSVRSASARYRLKKPALKGGLPTKIFGLRHCGTHRLDRRRDQLGSPTTFT
ncbi:MAG: arginase family protein [Chloracidobacterium sp.]|nr:arginase family protein [Chloracidobacterium sp.]